MSNEITTEVLAKAIDETKETVHSNDKNVRLNIQGKKQDYEIINKVASDDNSQLNAMAIAPLVNGKPDYNNVAIVYAGTNMPGETGSSGFGTAAGAATGGLSGEYQAAENFLLDTENIISKHKGTITDVAGFSQSGGYMMKMAAEHGKKFGFQTTSFDDWGRNQFETLNEKEQEWLKNHPDMLRRYQNDSWAGLSGRDSQYGTVSSISGIGMGEHNTLSKYLDGDQLNLDKLADDGIFAPNMTKEQVEKAAKNWAKKNGDWNPFTDDEDEANDRMKEYLKMYGTYATKEFSLQRKKLYQLRAALFSSGDGLSGNEQIYLDRAEAQIHVEKAEADFQQATETITTLYKGAIQEAQELWQETLSEARSRGTLLEEWEILDTLGSAEQEIVIGPCDVYQEKLAKINAIALKFSELVAEIKSSIDKLVQSDSELAQQIAGFKG